MLETVINGACYKQCAVAMTLAATLTSPPPQKTATEPPVAYIGNEKKYLPVLENELTTLWPTVEWKSPFGAQINQETCAGLKSKKCWSPGAELKTDREYGFGLGQLTVTPKFNNFMEAKKLHPSLRDWTWDNRYDAKYQIRTMVLMDKFNHGKLGWAHNEHERMAMAFGAYNGGLGGVLSDRTVCRATAGCDPTKWFGHIEHTSKKAKKPVKGYGKSFFEINREYVRNVMIHRRERYKPYFNEE